MRITPPEQESNLLCNVDLPHRYRLSVYTASRSSFGTTAGIEPAPRYYYLIVPTVLFNVAEHRLAHGTNLLGCLVQDRFLPMGVESTRVLEVNDVKTQAFQPALFMTLRTVDHGQALRIGHA